MLLQKSTRPNKKYVIFYNNKYIHFGDSRYPQYRDSTPLKLYSYMNHNDEQRRDNYLRRVKGIRDKNNNLTYKNKNSANYWAINFLWT